MYYNHFNEQNHAKSSTNSKARREYNRDYKERLALVHRTVDRDVAFRTDAEDEAARKYQEELDRRYP